MWGEDRIHYWCFLPVLSGGDTLPGRSPRKRALPGLGVVGWGGT